jgi:hypothetical protein
MNSRLVAGVVLLATCLWQGGCTTTRVPAMAQESAANTPIPPADPALDHFIAWVPADQAQTAAVARAMAHISLSKARRHAGQELCDGNSLRRGNATEILGPLPALSPPSQGGKPAWYYRISQQPGLFGCRQRNSAGLYQAMQEELPDWISIEPANIPPHLGLLEPVKQGASD